jgi:hypothetical protein
MKSLHARILEEIHKAIRDLGGAARPETPRSAHSALERLDAPPYLLDMVGAWRDTLTDAEVLEMLEDWNNGIGLHWTETRAAQGVTKP